jgi:threonine aldolase
LLALENTWGGRVLPRSYIAEAAALAKRHGLGFHLDGARLFNAAVAEGVAAREIARPFDSVSVCFSKGLGAPVGSMLLGSEELIARARRWRKVLGAECVPALDAFMQEHEIRLAIRGATVRLVLHLDIDDDGLTRAIAAFRDFFSR